MTGNGNLTRAEAAGRSALLRVDGYEVELDLTTGPESFTSTTRVSFRCERPGLATWIDLIAPAVRSVTLNGVVLDPAEVVDEDRIALPDLVARNTVEIVADCAYMRTGEGLHRFVDPVDDEVYLYTQFETADARRMYACFEQPDLKAPFRLTVTAPDHWQVISNSPTPEPVPVAPGVARWAFAPTPPLSTYITALVAGPYHVVRDDYEGAHGTYPLGVFCRRSLAQFLDADEVLTVTKQGFAYFEAAFDFPYPFAKYDQLFVPEFNNGAMENAGCVTIWEDYVFRSRVTDAAYEQRANTILHELAHMWFGDLVTMTWWDDLWLNESFAEWASHQANVAATRYTDAWTTFSNLRKAWAYRQDQLPSTHPIAADMVDLDSVRVNFDGITYAKGAAALRQLVAWVGEEQFLAGLRAYFARFAWGNTRLEDLLSELAAASGRDLSAWTAQWLRTSGVNRLRPEVVVDEVGCFRQVAVVQEPPSAPEGVSPTLRSHRVALGLYDLTAHGLVRRERLEIDLVGARTEVAHLTGVRQPDLLLVNDDDLTFAKIRFDPRSWRTVVGHLGALESSLARAVAWGAAWDMTRDAETSTGDYLDLVLAGLPGESDVGVVQTVLRQLRTAIDFYAAPEHRAAYLERLADALLAWTFAAPAGSDHQLAFGRGFAAAATTESQRGVVQGWLAGEAPAGLAIDTDLRWLLLQRLVTVGLAGVPEIEAELRRDDTATGRRQAAVAQAARPTPAAKEDAWASVTADDALPNALLGATVQGFVQADQVDLLRPYRDRYFAEIHGIARRRTPEMMPVIATGLYPALLVEEETVRRTDDFLADAGIPFGLRRLVIEGRDGVQRALRARRRDAAG